jgi:hypothetical protein
VRYGFDVYGDKSGGLEVDAFIDIETGVFMYQFLEQVCLVDNDAGMAEVSAVGWLLETALSGTVHDMGCEI